MSRAVASVVVPLPADDALRLWCDVDRWPSFVEGFARQLSLSPEWPAAGARVVWESNPGGRGRVTETVTAHSDDHFATRVYEDALMGVQTLRVAPAHDDSSHAGHSSEVVLSLDYELVKYGPLRAVADTLFIRRALRDALRRTLYRFTLEAEEDAGLR